jgi:hypothetical protein
MEYNELSNALAELADACSRVSKLLKTANLQTPVSAPVSISNKLHFLDSIELNKLPLANYTFAIPHQFGHVSKALELITDTFNKSSLIAHIPADAYHIVYQGCKPEPGYNKNLRICDSLQDTDTDYDLIIANESLELTGDAPATLATLTNRLNKGGKLYVRFRPWSSPNGGFQSSIGMNLAYAHVLSEIYHNGYNNESDQVAVKPCINNKVITPLATYAEWIHQAGLSIITQHINRKVIYFKPAIEQIIIKNIWPVSVEAKKIMNIHSIDYILSK